MSNVLFTLLGKIAIDSGSAEETIDSVTESAKGLAKQLDSTGTAADNTAANTGSKSKLAASSVWLGNMMTKATSLAYRFGKSIITTGMNYNQQVESQTATLSTLMNVSIEEAEAYYKKLEKFAEETPLSVSGVMENAIKMLNYGFDKDEVIPTLQMLGDIALGRDETLSRLVLAYTQVGAYTKLRAQEAYQFIEAGASVYEMLRDELGISTEELADMQEKGLIDFDTLDAALSAYTDENGRYYGAMQRMMETGEGQQEKMKDTYQRTLGNLLAPFYDEYVTNTLPGVNNLLDKFGAWVSENQESITTIAQALSDVTTYSLKWIAENGEAVATGLAGISTALIVSAIAAHPYLSILGGIISGLAILGTYGEKAEAAEETKLNAMKYQSFKEYAASDEVLPMNYSDEQLSNLERYVKVCKQIEQTEGVEYDTSTVDGILGQQQLDELKKEREQLIESLEPDYGAWYKGTILDAGGGIISEYDKWNKALNERGYIDESYPAYIFEAPYELPLTLEDGAEATVQSEINGMNFEAYVKMQPDMSELYSIYDFVTGTPQTDGSHASGLNYVPRDNYIARLHLGEAVLPRHEADVYRNGGNTTIDTSRLEALMQQVLGFMQQVAANTATGQTIVLDSGALVGSTVRQTDAELGKITTRKGRRN